MKLKRENVPNVPKIKKAKISYGDDLEHIMHDANHTEYIPDGKEHHEGLLHKDDDEHHEEHYGESLLQKFGLLIDFVFKPDISYHNIWAYIFFFYYICYCCCY